MNIPPDSNMGSCFLSVQPLFFLALHCGHYRAIGPLILVVDLRSSSLGIARYPHGSGAARRLVGTAAPISCTFFSTGGTAAHQSRSSEHSKVRGRLIFARRPCAISRKGQKALAIVLDNLSL